uniref:Uncharacterized protein n=1 Tax=viral metagenome TaxID=1070528 RepID=A0A6C0BWC4_9ZZZZ
MRVYFTNKAIHQKLVDVDDAVYEFLSNILSSAVKKQIYLADDGYYEIKQDRIYINCIKFNKTIQATSPDLIVSNVSWVKSEVNILPTNSIRVDFIVERFKINDNVTFVIERNDEESIDYFFEIKGESIEEREIISFLSQITNVCVN